MWTRIAWILAGFYGLTGVVLGAMGAHALKNKLTPALLASFQTGTRYQMFHALLLLALALLYHQFPSKLLSSSIVCAAVGTLFFSGSIYALTLLRWKVGIITPIGGLFLIVSWVLLMVAAFQAPISS